MNVQFSKIMISGDEKLSVLSSHDYAPVPYLIDTAACNPQLNVMNVSYQENDGQAAFVYDIAGMMSVKEFLDNHNVEVQFICALLKRICVTIIDSSDYLIPVTKFVFNPEFIFFGDTPLEIKMIIVPVKDEVSNEYDFRKMISEIVLELAVYDDEGKGFIESMLNLFKHNFSVEEVLNVCNEFEKLNMVKELLMEDNDCSIGSECDKDSDFANGGNYTNDRERYDNDYRNDGEKNEIEEKRKTSRGLLVKIIIILAVLFGAIFLLPSEWIEKSLSFIS